MDRFLFMTYCQFQRPDPCLLFRFPSGAEVLEEAKSIARELGWSEEKIEEVIAEAYSNAD